MNFSNNNKYFSILEEKIESKNIKVAIVGMGYVGLPLALSFVNAGIEVLGIDIDAQKIKIINSGKSPLKQIPHETVEYLVTKGQFTVSEQFLGIQKCDAVIICVPTPLNKHREPDLSFITSTLKSIKKHLIKGQILSLESTTYPETTEEIILPFIQEQNLTIGEEFFLVYSPERQDPGREDFTTETIPKVLGGTTEKCTIIGSKLYQLAIKTIVNVKDTKTAEFTKLFENIQRSVNIGLVNELKILADKMNIDIYEVISAAATKPFGFIPYYPGPGLGGHCIPIDPFYLTWKAKEYGINTKFIELAGEINKAMPLYVVSKLIDGLNQQQKSLKGSKILLLGLSYKKNIDDMRESPSIEIINILISKGALVDYSDPFFDEMPKSRNTTHKCKNIELSSDNLLTYDGLLLSTDHDCYDYDFILKHSKLIIDTRGRFSNHEKVVRA